MDEHAGSRRRTDAAAMERTAEAFDALAETADLMGDLSGADRFRASATAWRLRAMSALDP